MGTLSRADARALTPHLCVLALPEIDARVDHMREDVAADGLLRVWHEHVAGIGRHLVREHDGDVELLCRLDELAQVMGQLLLTLSKLTAAGELHGGWGVGGDVGSG